MNFQFIKFDWPYSEYLIIFGILVFMASLAWHGRYLSKVSTPKESYILIILRGLTGLFFLLLIARPFWDQLENDPRSARVVTLVDLSGSMNQLDYGESIKRIDQVFPFMDLDRAESWINQARNQFGTVERLGFTDSGLSGIRSFSWNIPMEGKDTSIGNSLWEVLDRAEDEKPSAVVLFSDGRNNAGRSTLEAGERFREYNIPVHVVGVGKSSELGNLSVNFKDFPSAVIAKQDLVLCAEIKNGFEKQVETTLRLFSNDLELKVRNLRLQAGETRMVRFSPHIPELAGIRTFRVSIERLEGDSDPADDTDLHTVEVRPPSFFSVLYLSHHAHPLHSFVKQSLSGDRFQLSSLIRLGESTFHARGEKVTPSGYPESPDFWMDFDVVLIDAGCLNELNSSLVLSLKDFVHKRGGGVLLMGDVETAMMKLGGLMPVIRSASSISKEDFSLSVFPDPIFTEHKRVEEWKPFIPAGLPRQLITQMNPAAQGIVNLRSNPDISVLAIQAYGAGKSAFWGSPHDWRRALIHEDHSREFSIFWQGLVEWLGSGTVERIKVQEQQDKGETGQENNLVIEAMGKDFEPSIDANVEANVSGPDGFSKIVQLYPQGGSLGIYEAKFIPQIPGSYRVNYQLSHPDGEKLERLSYLQIKQAGDEAKDTRYAERELRMLANISGGDFIYIENMLDDWMPNLSDSLVVKHQRKNLADAWPLFIALFLAAGMEWILRRRWGLK